MARFTQFDEIRGMRQRFIRAAYDLRHPGVGLSAMHDIMPEMSLDFDDMSDRETYSDIAQYFEGLGYIRRQADGYGIISITARGIQYVEGDLQLQDQPSITNITNIGGNAYGNIFGSQQHAEMNQVSFDFGTVEAELDSAEEEIDRRGGPDAELLRELVAEVRDLHSRREPVNQGALARYLGVIQRNGWIAGPVAGAILSTVTGA